MRHVSSAAAAVLMLVAARSPASAQSAPPSPGAVRESAGAVLIEIPVNVVGKDGKPVAGLTAADFELYDDGRKQPIRAVEVIDLAAPPANEAAPGQDIQALPASARRLWLLVFDLSYGSMSGLLRAREGARDFVAKSMPARDLAAVGTLSVDTGWKLLVNFTGDRRQLSNAIDSLGMPALGLQTLDPLSFAFTDPSGTRGGLAGGSMSSNEGMVAEEARETQAIQRAGNDNLARARVTRLLTALGGVGRVLDSVRGRKHVVFFSEGFETRLLSGKAAGGGRDTSLTSGSDGSALDASTTRGRQRGRGHGGDLEGGQRRAVRQLVAARPPGPSLWPASTARTRSSTRSTSADCGPRGTRRAGRPAAAPTPFRRWPPRPTGTSCATPTGWVRS